jgi:hypothetical protein
MVKRLRWTTDGKFTDPIIYAYDAPRGEVSPVGRVTWLPELVGLLFKAIHYFQIDARPDGPRQVSASRETLRTFFANQRLSDGSSLRPHLVNAMVTLCLPVRLMKGGRPRKGQKQPSLPDFYASQSACEREHILLRALGGEYSTSSGAPTDEGDENR